MFKKSIWWPFRQWVPISMKVENNAGNLHTLHLAISSESNNYTYRCYGRFTLFARQTLQLAWDPTCLHPSLPFPIKNKHSFRVLNSRWYLKIFLRNLARGPTCLPLSLPFPIKQKHSFRFFNSTCSWLTKYFRDINPVFKELLQVLLCQDSRR